MATIMFDSPYEEPAAKPPISVHPAFPAIVALWFAALLGLGSLVLPGALLDRMAALTGLASLVPAAAPPLGFTARGIIAIAGALVGAGLGISLARRVAGAHQPEAPSRAAKLANGSPRPISVREELGGEGVVNGESLPINRRRALAISEDDRPSDFLYRAPLPGEDPDAPAPAEEEPLELSELAQDDDPADEDFEMTDHREFKSTWPSHQHYPPESELEEANGTEVRKNLAGPRGLEPLPFSAPSLARRPVESDSEFEPEVQLEAVAEPAADEPEFHADWETAPLERLGLVQLVQRLGSTIERRRELMAQAPLAVAAPFAAAPADFDPAPAEEAAQAMAAFFAPHSTAEADEPAPMPRPQFLGPFAEDEDDGEDAIPDFSLPQRRPAAAAPILAAADEEPETDDDADHDAEEDGYSSLLGLSNPFAAPKNEFVRIEEPERDSDLAEPAVVFPGQEQPTPTEGTRPFDPPGRPVSNKAEGAAASAPQLPADADAALRAALATLQRMSGAA